MAFRFGRSVRLDKSSFSPSGGLRVDATLSRVGVFSYRFADGTERREFRSLSDVLDPRSIASLIGATVTAGHPEGGDMVSPSNWGDVAVGHVVAVEPKADCVDGVIDVLDAATIERIKSGELQELSPGYQCDYVEGPGDWNGEPYDGRQTNIIYNHIAALEPGTNRQGSNVSLRLDAASEIVREEGGHKMSDPLPSGSKLGQKTSDPQLGAKMKERIDGIEYDVGTPAHAKALSDHRARLDAEKAELATAKTRTDAAEAAAKTAKADAAKTIKDRIRVVTDARKVLAKVKDKKIREDATACLDADAPDVEGTPNDALAAKALKALSPGFDASGMSSDMIMGALLMAASMAGGGSVPIEDDDMGGDEETMLDGPLGAAPAPATAVKKPGAPPAFDAAHMPRGPLGAPRVDAQERTEETARAEKKRKDADAWKLSERVKNGTYSTERR